MNLTLVVVAANGKVGWSVVSGEIVRLGGVPSPDVAMHIEVRGSPGDNRAGWPAGSRGGLSGLF